MPLEDYVLNRNAQPTGEHEVHVVNGTCSWLPQWQNRIDLGKHTHCSSAVTTARNRYPGTAIDGCKHCCPDCHAK